MKYRTFLEMNGEDEEFCWFIRLREDDSTVETDYFNFASRLSVTSVVVVDYGFEAKALGEEPFIRIPVELIE